VPELPEVEINARNLRRWSQGRVIVAASAPRSRVLRPADPRSFARGLVGRRVGTIERIGKHLLIPLVADQKEAVPLALYSHLGMTGKWVRLRPGEAQPGHLRASLELDDGTVLGYRDQRLFGRLWRVQALKLRDLPELADLGPDPLAGGLDGATLDERLRSTRRAIHAALLDQSVIAGAGNIYAQEALFRAGIDPSTPATQLEPPVLDRIAAALLEVLNEALQRDDSDVEEGGENRFEVYDRAGQPCPRCGRPLERKVVGGRGVTWCRHDQPPDRPVRRRAARSSTPLAKRRRA
jgi:formamidopyrimidine-DNA glycosylase